LFDRQAEFISFRTFDDDVKRLISKLTTKGEQQPEPSEVPNTEQPGGDRVAGYNFFGGKNHTPTKNFKRGHRAGTNLAFSCKRSQRIYCRDIYQFSKGSR